MLLGTYRASAISNMARALREYKILGIKTTIPFHQRVLKNAAFLKGEYDTTFIDTRFDKEDLKTPSEYRSDSGCHCCRSETLRTGERSGFPCHNASGGRRIALEVLW